MKSRWYFPGVELSGCKRYGKGPFVTIHKDIAAWVTVRRIGHEHETGKIYGECKTQVEVLKSDVFRSHDYKSGR